MTDAVPLTPVEPKMPTPPRRLLPAHACDTHCHVFGPFDKFPLALPSSYPPPNAGADRHLLMLDTIGADRGVLVQPAPYGADHRAMIGALGAAPGRLRGVGVSSADIDEKSLRDLHDAGMRALRFVDMRDPHGKPYAGSVSAANLKYLAPRMKELGWHAVLWAPDDRWTEILPQAVSTGIPLVIDHMASVKSAHGVNGAAFQHVLRHVREGTVWVKLTLCRVSANDPDYPEMRPFHDALVAANSAQLLWGSDWPFVRLAEKSPDVGRLVDLVYDWLTDEDIRRRILVTNPAALYGFS